MPVRPYTVLSCCVSLDGYLDDGSAQRLVLSNDADLDRVDALRAASDAILVGAATVRHDDPRLLVRSPQRRADRLAHGLPQNPVKVAVTRCGELDPDARIFTTGPAERLVYCPDASADEVSRSLVERARVVPTGPGERAEMAFVCADLGARGVRRLLVEGGGSVLTQFLTQRLADELQLAVAPLFVGDRTATRFVGPGAFPWCAGHRARLLESRAVGDVVLLRYALSDRAATSPRSGS